MGPRSLAFVGVPPEDDAMTMPTTTAAATTPAAVQNHQRPRIEPDPCAGGADCSVSGLSPDDGALAGGGASSLGGGGDAGGSGGAASLEILHLLDEAFDLRARLGRQVLRRTQVLTKRADGALGLAEVLVAPPDVAHVRRVRLARVEIGVDVERALVVARPEQLARLELVALSSVGARRPGDARREQEQAQHGGEPPRSRDLARSLQHGRILQENAGPGGGCSSPALRRGHACAMLRGSLRHAMSIIESLT